MCNQNTLLQAFPLIYLILILLHFTATNLAMFLELADVSQSSQQAKSSTEATVCTL
jgi:hypothetical protein